MLFSNNGGECESRCIGERGLAVWRLGGNWIVDGDVLVVGKLKLEGSVFMTERLFFGFVKRKSLGMKSVK
ncbi:hypothetical protein [Bartonella birtlesii]|uniref:Uncharacterized protein n=1 Tax=Bartonella birtlesii LL-WM9 TaxID=1094552 RepID=J0YPG5_9HYPH|nr:hypothetical protein [Bartonella birtlesii]EJF76603.1 hypothetical protein ME7_00860 [Bartonella birtlesii LL-WM9]